MLYISFDIPGPTSGTLQVSILPSHLFQVEATLPCWPQPPACSSKLFLAIHTLNTTDPQVSLHLASHPRYSGCTLNEWNQDWQERQSHFPLSVRMVSERKEVNSSSKTMFLPGPSKQDYMMCLVVPPLIEQAIIACSNIRIGLVARICRSQSSKDDQSRQGRGSIPRFGTILLPFCYVVRLDLFCFREVGS